MELTGIQIGVIFFSVATLLSVCFVALIGRLNGGMDDDDMVDGYEPHNPEHVIDIRAINQRYAGE